VPSALHRPPGSAGSVTSSLVDTGDAPTLAHVGAHDLDRHTRASVGASPTHCSSPTASPDGTSSPARDMDVFKR